MHMCFSRIMWLALHWANVARLVVWFHLIVRVCFSPLVSSKGSSTPAENQERRSYLSVCLAFLLFGPAVTFAFQCWSNKKGVFSCISAYTYTLTNVMLYSDALSLLLRGYCCVVFAIVVSLLPSGLWLCSLHFAPHKWGTGIWHTIHVCLITLCRCSWLSIYILCVRAHACPRKTWMLIERVRRLHVLARNIGPSHLAIIWRFFRMV